MSSRLPLLEPPVLETKPKATPKVVAPKVVAPKVVTKWRSLKEKAAVDGDAPLVSESVSDERSLQGAIVEESSLTRRGFLTVGSATAAAVGLSGCLRRPAEQILPYSQAPEYSHPGIPLHFATTTQHRGEAVGLLVESHEGRPTKIEGNPRHPASAGRTDASLQARIWDLYDDDRSGTVVRDSEPNDWSDLDAWIREKSGELEATGGTGLRILAPPNDSPSFLAAQQALVARYPGVQMHVWESVDYGNLIVGAQLAFGQPVRSRIDYSRARVILSLDSDFLSHEPGALRSAREFSAGRALDSSTDTMNRLYVVESTFSVTGMNADHRLRVAPSQVDRYLRALVARFVTMADQLPAQHRVPISQELAQAVAGTDSSGIPQQWLDLVVRDLAQNRGASVVSVGWRQPPHVHALAAALNGWLGNVGTTIAFFDAFDSTERDPARSMSSLISAMGAGNVETLLILGGNPVYDAPGFAEALANVETTVHVSPYNDETSAACTWHIPETHELESWGDHRGIDGTRSIQQPLIAPLLGGRTTAEILSQFAGIRDWRAHRMARRVLRNDAGPVGAQFDRLWRVALHAGVVPLPGSRPRALELQAAQLASNLRERPATSSTGWEVSFIPSYQTFDGRQANNPWLLEMPDPVTKVVWDNAAYLSPASAEALGIDVHIVEERAEMPRSEMVNVSIGGASITIAAIVLPGHPDNVVSLPLGFGRTNVGRFGNDCGVDVTPLRTLEDLGFRTGAEVAKANQRYPLVQTQDHHRMDGRPVSHEVRPIAIDATLEEYRNTPDFAQWRELTPDLGPLWTQVDYSGPRPPATGGQSYSLVPQDRQARPGAPPRYKWGFVVDLTRCTGCSACSIACQAENNIAFVGKTQVARGREMHWMRLDRYYVGDDPDDPKVIVQPVACQHCEEAPCENVCPVAATPHSPEGLNDMAYNRCIGTRYCMNNCPYKVRRFNFLDWHGGLTELGSMQFNPNVTVRMRGVMEKCSYCVQRIQYARIQARRRTIVDGDEIDETRIQAEQVTPACAQACPSEALTFGDLNDTEGVVHQRAHIDRGYKLLASIGTQPRTTYLGKVRNPNPAWTPSGGAA